MRQGVGLRTPGRPSPVGRCRRRGGRYAPPEAKSGGRPRHLVRVRVGVRVGVRVRVMVGVEVRVGVGVEVRVRVRVRVGVSVRVRVRVGVRVARLELIRAHDLVIVRLR